MPFTPAQLAMQMGNPNLNIWAASTLQNQAPLIPAYMGYFNGLQAWIDQNGGDGNPFGWDNVNGLQVNGVQVVLQDLGKRSAFNDAFNDVRQHLGHPGFRLFQAAAADIRLITVLHNM